MTVATSHRQAEPFVKWAGGKRRVARHLREFIPQLGKRSKYYEPFLGGGALFFGFQPPRAILGDTIDELVETFRSNRSRPTLMKRGLTV
jgi:DNA adenine methylase